LSRSVEAIEAAVEAAVEAIVEAERVVVQLGT